MSDGMYEAFSDRAALEAKPTKINKYVTITRFVEHQSTFIENTKQLVAIALKDKTILKIADKIRGHKCTCKPKP